jgi:hypothetical protein
VVGETDARSERPRFKAYRPTHVLATLYRLLGVKPGEVTFPDYSGRPQFVLDHPDPIPELLG